MTLFIADTSGYQPDFNYSASGLDGFIIKATEGTLGYYRNPSFPTQLSRSQATGKPTIAYHYVRGTDVQGQANNITGYVSQSVPVALDLEAGGDVATTRALATELRHRGYKVPLLYVPHWWLGDATNVADIAPLWSSNYPASGSSLTQVYTNAGGDAGSGWAAYGGASPSLWQFSSSISTGGYASIDVSAFRGSLSQLAALFTASVPQPIELDDCMYVICDQLGFAGELSGGILIGYDAASRTANESSLLAYQKRYVTAAVWNDMDAKSKALLALGAKVDAVTVAVTAIPPGHVNLTGSVPVTGSLNLGA